MDFSQVDDYIQLFEKKNNIQSESSKKEDIENIEKKQRINYEKIYIPNEYSSSEPMANESLETIEFGKLNTHLYEYGLIEFEEKCIFVIIYIPVYNSKNEYKYNNRFKNPIFQLFQSIALNEYNYLDAPLHSNEYDLNYIDILKFEDTLSLQTIVLRTIDFIKYSMISRIKRLENRIDVIKKEYVFEDTYLQNEIAFYKGLQQKYELMTQSETIYCYDLISTLAIEIDTEDLMLKNIDLETIEIEQKNNKIREIIEEFSSTIPGIGIGKGIPKKYIVNEDLYCVLLNECDEDIEYITDYVKFFCNNKHFIDCKEILALLESKKGIIEKKMVDR